MKLENHGMGNNVTVQVLDAIFCHNGEMLEGLYSPTAKTKEEFLLEYENSYKDKLVLRKVKPMTLEGCVVRISDIIAYIGKDIDDAIRLDKLKVEDIPLKIVDVLGASNSSIVDTIIKDIISNSVGKNYIKISDTVYKALNELIDFNYSNIYIKANTKKQIEKYERMFNELFDLYYEQLNNCEISEDIYKMFLNDMYDDYNKNESNARKVIDYIAGMTDDFFMSQYEKYFG